MRTSLAALLVLAAAAALLAAPSAAGAASFKRCGTLKIQYLGTAKYAAKGVSCRAAKKVLRTASTSLCFDNRIPGWKKEWHRLPDGRRALMLTKGAKAIKTDACARM